MIAKHVPMRTVKKSDVGALVEYLVDEQEKQERLGVVTITNCEANRVDAALLEITGTQQKNTRAAADKTYHLVVSFPPGEVPDKKVMAEIEAALCNSLGFGEHQRISVTHNDTDHYHLHVAINKIHPTNLTIHTPYRDHKTLGQLCEALELKYGLQVTNHQPKRNRGVANVNDMEQHSGVESFLTWLKNTVADPITNASSWADVHATLSEKGIALIPRGNGLVFVDSHGLMVKASSVTRSFSKAALEARLGVYSSADTPLASDDSQPFPPKESIPNIKPNDSAQPRPTASNKPGYSARPLPLAIDTTVLYAQYQAAMNRQRAAKTDALAQLGKKRKRKLNAIKNAGQLRRAAIKLTEKGKDHKRGLYKLTHLAIQAEYKQLASEIKRERDGIYRRHQNLSWVGWLQQRASNGDALALQVLRHRQKKDHGLTNRLHGSGPKQGRPVRLKVDSITKRGSVVYSSKTVAIRDDGEKLVVSRHQNQSDLIKALRLTQQRYGSHITVNGSDSFKQQIVQAAVAGGLAIQFNDEALEQQRIQLTQTREPTHEQKNNRSRPGFDGVGNGFDGSDRRDGEDRGRNQPGRLGRIGVGGKAFAGKLHQSYDKTARFNRAPESQDGLPKLSDIIVAQVDERATVLLPNHARNNLVRTGTERDQSVRRPLSSTGGTTGITDSAGNAACQAYIAEREAKRKTGLSIAKHRLYQASDGKQFEFGGLRTVNNETVILLKHKDEILVISGNKSNLTRLKQLKLGVSIFVQDNGAVQKQRQRSR